MADEFYLLDSITDAREEHRGGVAVSGSHGGLYPAAVASRAGLRGVIFNDAGRGLEEAGVAGARGLDAMGMAAACVDCMTCLIGSASDAAANGVISFANAEAAALGVAPGQGAREAALLLLAARAPEKIAPAIEEARRERAIGGVATLLVDSASLVRADDAGAVIVAGSHGGLIGGDPARALKTDARFAAFNDAGVGKDACGVSRLPALEARGVAAVAVSASTARIGDAASAVETGVISAVNAPAAALGARIGAPLREAIARLGA